MRAHSDNKDSNGDEQGQQRHSKNKHHTPPQIATTAHIPAGRKAAVVVGGSSGPGPERPRSRLHLDHWGRLKAAGWVVYG